MTAIEGNGRQVCPDANADWVEGYPTIFEISDGTVGTGCLTKPGLGH